MEILNNVISSQGNQENTDSQLDSDLEIENQYKFRNEHQENKYDSDLEQKLNQKKLINEDGEQVSTTNETHDDYTKATLDDSKNAIDYDDKEDDDLKEDDDFLIKKDVLENDENENEDVDTSFPRSKSSSFPYIY